MIQIDKELFQWELNRQALVTNPSISFVYFYNKNSQNSKKENILNGIVNIPDTLLKENLPIVALCCDKNKKVVGRKVFKVLSAKRPEDYVDPEDYLEIIYDGGIEQ